LVNFSLERGIVILNIKDSVELFNTNTVSTLRSIESALIRFLTIVLHHSPIKLNGITMQIVGTGIVTANKLFMGQSRVIVCDLGNTE
jgi:hypothetical protein